jgi:hypothetical protein
MPQWLVDSELVGREREDRALEPKLHAIGCEEARPAALASKAGSA